MYHYQPLGSPEMMSWIERAILRHEIYFSSPASFNDPFDCKISLSTEGTRNQKIDFIIAKNAVTRDEAEKVLTTNPRLFQNAMDQVLANFCVSIGVYSLSELSNDILMWSHYASSHRGICLVFAGEMFPNDVVERIIYPWNNEYPKADIFTSKQDEQRDAILLTKAKHWEYEREWRVIDKGGPGYHTIFPNWLSGIIFGCATAVPQIAEIKRMALMRNPPLQLSQAKKKSREFALSIEPL
jgi:hypothetical protein